MKIDEERPSFWVLFQRRLRSLGIVLLLSLTGAYSAYYFSPQKPRLLGEDSYEYLEAAGAIRRGTFLKGQHELKLPRGALTRGPGYPCLLALFRIEHAEGRTLYFAHGAVTGASLAILWLLLGGIGPKLVGIAGFLTAYLMWFEFFDVLSTEWLAYSLLLTVAAAFFHFSEKVTTRALLSVTFFGSSLALVRPDYLFVPFLICALVTSRVGFRSAWQPTILGNLILGTWLAVNYLYRGVIGVSALGGSALFVGGSMLGTVEPASFSHPKVQEFARVFNQSSWVAEDSDLTLSATPGAPLKIFSGYVGNLHRAWKIAGDTGLNPLETDHILGVYGRKAIATYSKRYLIHVFSGITACIPDVLLYVILCIVWALLAKPHTALFFTLRFIFLIHIIHTLVVISTQPLLNRYFFLTQIPFVTLYSIAACSLLWLMIRRETLPVKAACGEGRSL